MATSLKTALTSSPMKWAAGGWSLFIVENLILSENRTYIIDSLGDDGYHYLYGFLSTAAVGSILYGYRYKVKSAGPFAWPVGAAAPPAAKVASFALQALALGMASQSFPKLQIPVHVASDSVIEPRQSAVAAVGPAVPGDEAPPSRQWKVRCPFDFTDSKSQTGDDKSNPTRNPDGSVQLHGLDRVSRHPGLWSFGLLGVGNALLSPSLPTRVWMSMPLMVALIGGDHTDSRHRRGIGGTLCKEMDAVTSNVPFLAMITGRQEDGSVTRAFSEFSKEFKWLNAGVAAVVAGGWVATRGRGSPRISSSVLAR